MTDLTAVSHRLDAYREALTTEAKRYTYMGSARPDTQSAAASNAKKRDWYAQMVADLALAADAVRAHR